MPPNSRFDEAFDWYEGFYLPDDVVFTDNLRRALEGEELPMPGADYDFRTVSESISEWTESHTFTEPLSDEQLRKMEYWSKYGNH